MVELETVTTVATMAELRMTVVKSVQEQLTEIQMAEVLVEALEL